jgi:methyltransferase (TIGR00027 family)
MEEGRPSSTAMGAATARAAHLLLDSEPKILRDELALGFSGMENEAALRAALQIIQAELVKRSTPELAPVVFRTVRTLTTMRSRYAEDELSKAIERGVAQYVMLGAGLDSFAYRRRDLAQVVHVFEVDYPATQAWKQARLRTLGIELPSNLTFIPIDFEKQSLADALRAGGYRAEKPAFFSWLGVTEYLTEEAIFTTLQVVAAMASESEIVFGYDVSETLLDEENRRLLAVFKAFAAARGEPIRSLFEPTNLVARVKALGFAKVWDVGPEEANARYFAGRTDGLRASPLYHLMKGQVGSTSSSEGRTGDNT